MNEQFTPESEIWALFDAACSDALEADQVVRLEAALHADERLRDLYLDYFRLHAELFRSARLERAREKIIGAIRHPESVHSVPPIISVENPPFPSLSPLPSPLTPNFVGGPVFSYMTAVVILGVMLLGAWAYKITHFQPPFVKTPAPSVTSDVRLELVFVGRITGMVECEWSDPSTEPFAGAYVPLWRKYALASGLMEITYKTGAKVILEGPCTYEVESCDGGYLSLGKLTAKVETRGEGRGARDEGDSHYPLSTIHYPLFSVRTPTAIITDLGTEFGVEVGENGLTISHVFRGSVWVQVVGANPPSSSGRGPGGEGTVVLRKNESVQVVTVDGNTSITRRAVAEALRFVREMPPTKSVRENQTYTKLVLSLKPVVYYRMERPRNNKDIHRVFDSASGRHHGELRLGNEYGQPYLPGRFGKSLWFRGPEVCDRVIVPDYPKAVNDRLTVSAWVLATGQPGWAMIASNWGQPREEQINSGQFHLGLYQLDGDLCARVTQRDGQWVEVREGAKQPFPTGVWQHVVLVADGTTLHLYRDGKQVASTPCVGILPKSPVASLGIGCRTNGAGTEASPDPSDDQSSWTGYYYWQGRIDELVVLNRALSAETVWRLYLGKPSRDSQTGTTSAKKGDEPMDGP